MVTDQQIRERLKPDLARLPEVQARKAPLTNSHIQDLSLLVNTGGVFNPEETP